MKFAAWALSDAANLSTARVLGRIAQKPFVKDGVISSLPGIMGAWTSVRDMPAIPPNRFGNGGRGAGARSGLRRTPGERQRHGSEIPTRAGGCER